MNQYAILFTAILWVLGAFAVYRAGYHKSNNFEDLKRGECGLVFGDKGTENLLMGMILVVWPLLVLRKLFQREGKK